jgi:hypothetical protein
MRLCHGLVPSSNHLNSRTPTLKTVQLVQGHKGPITSLAAQRLASGTILLASTAADESVLIWECAPDWNSTAQSSNGGTSSPSGAVGTCMDWKLVQSIPWGVQLQHCAALTHLQGKPNWCGAFHTSCACDLCLHALTCRHLDLWCMQSRARCLARQSLWHVSAGTQCHVLPGLRLLKDCG